MKNKVNNQERDILWEARISKYEIYSEKKGLLSCFKHLNIDLPKVDIF